MLRYLFLYEKHNHLTRKIPCKHIMQHLSYTSRSSIFRFGIGMLLLFFFCAPTLAQSSQGFKSTSAYQINASVQSPNVVNQYGAYKSTIYQPFSESAPTSDNPSGGSSGINGRRNATIGIPDWGGTMSEPLPITDGTPFLLLIAAIMAITIFLKQRKQKQLKTTQHYTTQSNTPQHPMTTNKQTYQSLLPKLFMLLVFVCVAGQATAESKSIYFRPSTITVYREDLTEYKEVNWSKYSNTWFAMLKQTNGGTTRSDASWHVNDYTTTYKAGDIYAGSTNPKNDKKQLRFLGYTISDVATWKFAFYRISGDATYANYKGKTLANTGTSHLSDCVPGNKWWSDGNNNTDWYTNMFTVNSLGGEHNLIGVHEGEWGGTGFGEGQGYYCAYYVDEDAHLYFANIHEWGDPKFLRGKDVYTYKENAEYIPNTKLYYTYLQGKAEIAYKQYAYIDNTTGDWDDTEWRDLWKNYPNTTKMITPAELSQNIIQNRIKEYGMHTVLTENRLAGKTLLFVPGANNNAAYERKETITSYEALNFNINVQIHTYTRKQTNTAQPNDVYTSSADGGSVEYYSYTLNGQNSSIRLPNEGNNTTSGAAQVNMPVAYTGEMHLKAIPHAGYQFMGWYDTAGNCLSTNPEWYTFNNVYGDRTIVARFRTVEHNIRTQTPLYAGEGDNKEWAEGKGEHSQGWQSNSLGGTVEVRYTTNEEGSTSSTEESIVIDQEGYKKVLTHGGTYLHLYALPKEGYTFIGWWNNTRGRVKDNPWIADTEYSDCSMTARFAILRNHTVEVNTYDAVSNSFTNQDADNGGTVTIEYYDASIADYATETISGSKLYKAVDCFYLTLTATNKEGYTFIGWYDGATGELLSTTATEYKHKATKDQTIVARFSIRVQKKLRTQTYNETKLEWETNATGGSILFEYNNGMSETHSGEQTTYDLYKNSLFTCTAIPNEGYTFIGWWNNRQGKTPEVLTASPWTARTDTTDVSITARFAKCYTQTVNVTTYNTETLDYEANNIGGTATITYNDGRGTTTATITPSGEYRTIINSPCTLTVTATKTGYIFLGWYDGSGACKSTNTTYTIAHATASNTINARFVKKNSQTLQVTPSGGAGGTVTLTYNDGTAYTVNNIDATQTFNTLVNTNVDVVATPKMGYDFVGWYYNGTLVSISPEYSFVGKEDNATIVAEFGISNREHTVSIMTYDPTYNKYLPDTPGGKVTYSTKKSQGGSFVAVTGETETAASFTVGRSQTVTLTAVASEGYTFEGWYENEIQLTPSETDPCKYEYTAGQVSRNISARFKIGNGIKFTLQPNTAGTYSLRFSHQSGDGDGDKYIDPNVDYFYSKESSLTKPVISYAYSYDDAKKTVYYSVSNPKPILGYEFYCWHFNNNTTPIEENHQASTGSERKILADFRRTEDQVVYLNLNDQWAHSNHQYYVYAANVAKRTNATDLQFEWIPMELVAGQNYYKASRPIPANTYSHIVFTQFASGAAEPTVAISELTTKPTNKTDYLTIPATRFNCYKLKSYWKNGEYHDAWTNCPTTNGDFRVLYREQTVVSKTEIRTDYEKPSDVIKQGAAGQTDIINLHIYNKVSDGEFYVNNPELILQKRDGDTWVDIERRMVFGPLKSSDAGVIRIPGRKNAASTLVYDKGITAIRQVMDNAEKDYGCGVWNFVVKQDGSGNATIIAEETTPYAGNYYIRTANAEGMYQDFTHPGNIMTFSQYAKDNSDFSHYYCRYIDIPGAEETDPKLKNGKKPGTYTSVKFAVATDHAYWLSKELVVNNDRFSDDEYAEDIFIEHRASGATLEPLLRNDANVRFGWDMKTNRLTRAYIASSQDPNLDYLVLENASGITPTSTNKFTEGADWLYHLDVTSTTKSTAKVKAEMNGYAGKAAQYFLGTETQDGEIVGGNGIGSYPIRLLYDFKEDHFTTIYYPQGTISGNVDINTPVMILREHNDAPTQVTFSTNATVSAEKSDAYGKPAYAVMTFLGNKLTDPAITHHEKMFYWVSFPYDVKISDVFGLGDYGQYWIMQYYDGKQRAQYGLKYTNWKYILDTEAELKANQGYIICLNYSQLVNDGIAKKGNKISLYFPSMSNINAMTIKGGQTTEPVTLEEYTDKTTNSNTAWNHHNWHVIGVPSYANPTFSTIQGDVPFFYQYWHPTDGYAAVASNEVDFYAMHSYMVQYTGKIQWTSVVNTAPQSLAARRDAAAEERIMLRLELQQAGSTIDKTYVQLRNDKGTKGFDMSLDLTKIINAGANIYSIVDNHEMAGNAIPKEETVLPLGVVITAAGEYTFAMPQGTEGMVVELIDYEQGTYTNLLVGDYTVNMPVGTNNTRFALRLVPDKVATSVDNIGNEADGNKVRKLFIDGVLYLQQGNSTYDAQGKHVQ